MAEYNGKYKGAEIDALLDKTKNTNVSAVDTGDVLDDVAVEYVTKTYFDSVVGDINSVLESIVGGTSSGSDLITFYIDDGGGVTSMNASQNMTFGEFVNSEYANQNNMFTNFKLFDMGSYNGVTFYHEEAMSDLTLYKDSGGYNVRDNEVIENNKTYYAF